jgi:hypothetical protein
MTRLSIGLLCFFYFGASPTTAQTKECPKLPEKYEWHSARDYKRDEDLVLRTLQWLTTTPLNEDASIRGKANLFVMEWICGSPRIKIKIESDKLPFYIDYPDLLFPYIHGVAQCKLAKNTTCNELQAAVNGFNSVAYMIRTDDELKKSKALQPILKASKKDKMESYVQALMTNKTAR